MSRMCRWYKRKQRRSAQITDIFDNKRYDLMSIIPQKHHIKTSFIPLFMHALAKKKKKSYKKFGITRKSYYLCTRFTKA